MAHPSANNAPRPQTGEVLDKHYNRRRVDYPHSSIQLLIPLVRQRRPPQLVQMYLGSAARTRVMAWRRRTPVHINLHDPGGAVRAARSRRTCRRLGFRLSVGLAVAVLPCTF